MSLSTATPRAQAGRNYKHFRTYDIRTGMENRPGVYLTIAFAAGVLLTLGFKDFYPDLERRFRRRRRGDAVNSVAGAGLERGNKVDLQDHTRSGAAGTRVSDIPQGIEACIGNTPLFKINSLSDATGCDILGKAEVQTRSSICFTFRKCQYLIVR